MTTAPTAPPPARRKRSDTLGVRLVLVLGAIVLAYHFSLQTLISNLGLETPLAYLGLVPFIALGLAALRARPRAGEPDIHDREFDFIVGVPLVAAALAAAVLLPSRLSTLFWVYRIDILSLPVFVFGIVTLVFGTRAAWRLRFPIGFLLLAWPVPYKYLVDNGTETTTGWTLSALKSVLAHWHVAAPQAGGDGSLFLLGSGAHTFPVSVASACAGVNSTVGFLLVGIAFAYLVNGPRLGKAAWLLSGLFLIWALNIIRLLLIFQVGKSFGEKVAIDGLHPFIGLVLFCAGVMVMLWAMPLFRLSLELPPRDPGAPTMGQLFRQRAALIVPGARGLRVVGIAVVAAAVVLAGSNGSLARYTKILNDLGGAELVAFKQQPAVVPGFSGNNVANYPWASRFFGSDSTWDRYVYAGQSTIQAASTGAARPAPTSIVVDVVSTNSLRALSAYGIESCYRFHGYDIKRNDQVQLAGGITADLITYRGTDQPTDFNALAWVWPVKDVTGTGSHYERIVLLQSTTAGLLASDPSAAITKDTSYRATSSQGLTVDTSAELRRFAGQMITSRVDTKPAVTTAANGG